MSTTVKNGADKFSFVEYRKYILQLLYFAIVQRVRNFGIHPLPLKLFHLYGWKDH